MSEECVYHMDGLILESLASLNDWCTLSLAHLVFIVCLIAITGQGDLCGIPGMGGWHGQENKRRKIWGGGERFLEGDGCFSSLLELTVKKSKDI